MGYGVWSSFELVGYNRRLFKTCSEPVYMYVDVECNQLIFIIKTGNDTFLS